MVTSGRSGSRGVPARRLLTTACGPPVTFGRSGTLELPALQLLTATRGAPRSLSGALAREACQPGGCGMPARRLLTTSGGLPVTSGRSGTRLLPARQLLTTTRTSRVFTGGIPTAAGNGMLEWPPCTCTCGHNRHSLPANRQKLTAGSRDGRIHAAHADTLSTHHQPSVITDGGCARDGLGRATRADISGNHRQHSAEAGGRAPECPMCTRACGHIGSLPPTFDGGWRPLTGMAVTRPKAWTYRAPAANTHQKRAVEHRNGRIRTGRLDMPVTHRQPLTRSGGEAPNVHRALSHGLHVAVDAASCLRRARADARRPRMRRHPRVARPADAVIARSM